MAKIAVLGTFDTKGHEHAYVAQRIRMLGHQSLLIDVGVQSTPQIVADISREDVLASSQDDDNRSTGTVLTIPTDRGEAVEVMADAASRCLQRLFAERRIDAIISLGGSGGTAIATRAMRALPLGVPKVMVSTLASGNVAAYLGDKDVVMIPAIVDVAGLNSVSRGVFARAAAAVCGMADANTANGSERSIQPLIVASMFGNTTRCVEHARQLLEAAGFEVLVFHATGSGGRTMESLIDSGMVAGVLDVTTTEWADELVGGVLSAGPHRLEAAARNGVPAVVAPGCLDMVNFGAPDSVPQRFADRKFYRHSPEVTLMRTTPMESRRLGEILADKLNQSVGPVSVLLPRKAISVVSAPGQPFHDPDADAQLFDAIQSHLRSDIDCKNLDCEINDPAFAEACVKSLLNLLRFNAS